MRRCHLLPSRSVGALSDVVSSACDWRRVVMLGNGPRCDEDRRVAGCICRDTRVACMITYASSMRL